MNSPKSATRKLAAVILAGAAAAGCYATTGPAAPAGCNPIMEQCNEADLPPLTAQLPPWPFPRLMQPLAEGEPQ